MAGKTGKQKYLNAAEYGALLGAAKAQEDYMLLYLLGNLGLRVSEGIRLRVEDIDKLNRSIRVPTLKQGKVKGIQRGRIARGALPSTYIDLPINESTISKINAYLKARKIKSGWLFPCPDGKHTPDWKAKKIFKACAAAAGLDPIYSVHSLRHYRGVALYSSLKDIRAVQVLLRHRNIASTTIYTEMDLDAKRAMVEGMTPVE